MRAFTMVEVLSVTAIVGIVASVGVAMSARTSDTIDDGQNQLAILNYIQRERHAHVTRGEDLEFIVICPSTGTDRCEAQGNRLLTFRLVPPLTVTPDPTALLSSQTFSGTIRFIGQAALIVDSYARSVDTGAGPRTVALSAVQRASTQTINFDGTGLVTPTFDAPNAITVAPRLVDLGSRATPNPTPMGGPARQQKVRQVTLE